MVIFRKKNKRKLQFNLNQNRITVEAPGNRGAENWWQDIQQKGGVPVLSGQQVKLAGTEPAKVINFLFHDDGTLDQVTGGSLNLIVQATDRAGNVSVASVSAARPCDDNANLSAETIQDHSFRQQETPAALEVFPNPFSEQGTIRFQMPQAGPVVLEVFSLDGRRLLSWNAGFLAAGLHQETWKTIAATAPPLHPGFYFFQLRTQQQVMTRKVAVGKHKKD